MIIGDRINLRAIEEWDLETLKEWRNNPDNRKYFREYRSINNIGQRNWFENIVSASNNTLMFSIVDKQGELLGACGLCYINWVQRNADLSIYIGKDDIYIDDDGIAIEVVKLLLHYGFDELNLNKIWTEIYTIDEKKIRLFDGLKFHRDGLLRENYFYDGKWVDSIIFSILQKEWCSDGN